MASATTSGWAVVLIDEGRLPSGRSTLVHELKRQIPHASVILQSTRTTPRRPSKRLKMVQTSF